MSITFQYKETNIKGRIGRIIEHIIYFARFYYVEFHGL